MTTATTSALQQQVDWPAVDARRAFGALLVSEGVSQASHLVVSQRGAGANMSVDVAPGSAWVADDHGSGGGYYPATWTAVENVLIATADPTNPRIDRIVLRVHDAALGDADNTIAIVPVAGTPTSGADLTNLTGAAAVPGSSLLLANILVPAAATSIVTADIRNVATAAGSSGGGGFPLYDSGPLASTAATIDSGATGFSTSLTHLRILVIARSDAALNATSLRITLNGDSGANYSWGDAADALGGNGTSFYVAGSVAAASETAGEASVLVVELPFYSQTTFRKGLVSQSGGGSFGFGLIRQLGGTWRNTAAVNRVTAALQNGSFTAGSRMIVYGF